MKELCYAFIKILFAHWMGIKRGEYQSTNRANYFWKSLINIKAII